MAVLRAATRNALPAGAFAGPDRSFPIPDKLHAVQALRMAHFAANPEAVRAKVVRKFPGVGGSLKDAVMAKLKG